METVHFTPFDLLNAAETFDSNSIKQLMSELNRILEKRKKLPNSKEEQELIEQIYYATSSPTYARYKTLTVKIREENITTEEYEELMTLVPKIDDNTLIRLKNLSRLAEIREISVQEVMKQLGLL